MPPVVEALHGVALRHQHGGLPPHLAAQQGAHTAHHRHVGAVHAGQVAVALHSVALCAALRRPARLPVGAAGQRFAGRRLLVAKRRAWPTARPAHQHSTPSLGSRLRARPNDAVPPPPAVWVGWQRDCVGRGTGPGTHPFHHCATLPVSAWAPTPQQSRASTTNATRERYRITPLQTACPLCDCVFPPLRASGAPCGFPLSRTLTPSAARPSPQAPPPCQPTAVCTARQPSRPCRGVSSRTWPSVRDVLGVLVMVPRFPRCTPSLPAPVTAMHWPPPAPLVTHSPPLSPPSPLPQASASASSAAPCGRATT